MFFVRCFALLPLGPSGVCLRARLGVELALRPHSRTVRLCELRSVLLKRRRSTARRIDSSLSSCSAQAWPCSSFSRRIMWLLWLVDFLHDSDEPLVRTHSWPARFDFFLMLTGVTDVVIQAWSPNPAPTPPPFTLRRGKDGANYNELKRGHPSF